MKIYDTIIERLFDAADNIFQLRPILTGLIITPLMANPVAASDICDNLVQTDHFMLFHEQAAKVIMDFDTSAHSICYSFTPLINNMKVEPDHLCIKLGDEIAPPIRLHFNDGPSYDISDIYNPEMTLRYYNFYLKACYDIGFKI